ncbi:MAG: hypothetical protein JNL97_11095, partial [Verrucomicrobiales bacterium]|nr:hypothetical protein [Verrucomicrobiales bacterium]
MCALAVAPSPDTPSVDGASLDPLIADLGRLIGLLRPSDSRRYTLDREWFDHPLGAIRDGFRTHPAALTDLLERILGSLGGNALGVPASDPALLGTWIPIPNPANRAASVTPGPLYLVSYEHEGRTVYGFGVKVAWEKDLTADSGGSNGTLHGPPGIRAEAWALLPLLALDPENGVGPAVGNPGYPLSVGIAVEGRKSDDIAPIITAGVEPNLFSFDGIKISAEIDLATGPSVEVSVVVLGLELPGETAADRSLADLEALEASEIMQTASTLFVAALSDLSPAAAATAGYLLPVLGLSEFVPNIETRLPLLAWYDLAARAVAGQPVTGPFVEWFTTVVGDADLTRTWLASLAGLVGHPSPGKDAVTGRGTRAEPFLVPLIAPGGALPGSLAFAVASEVDAGSGVRHFYPGIAFALTPVALGAKAELTLRSEIELAEFGLSATRPIDYAGPASLRLRTALRLQGTGGTTSLFEGRIGGDDYVFGALHAGLELDAGGGIAPLFRLENVRSPAGVFDVVDLTSPGQLASRAEQELLALVQSGLKQMLGVQAGVDVPFGANLAALLGVIAPPAAASWPADAPQPPFSATRIVDSLQDPLGALARYYHALATTATTVDGHSPFRLVLQELAGLLQLAATNAGVTITGDGTETSPWRAMLSTHGTPLPAALLVSAVPTTEGRTRLTFGLELGPTVTVGALTLEPRALVRLLSVDLPSPGAGGSISAEWLPAVGMALNLPNGFRTPEVAGSSFRVGASALGATWSRRDGWHWSLLARKPEFTLGGTRLPFSADLDWSDRQSLENLVRQSADSFAPVLVGVLGLALTSRSTRIGTALTGFFGLLPDLSRTRNFPPKLADAWKTAAPAPLRIRHLDDPWPDLRAQVAANFASTPSARAVLGLLGWALQPGAADPPDVSGSGGSSDPWRVPIAGTAFEFLTWFESTEQLLGCGLGRTDVFTSCPGLRVVARTSLGAACVSLASGTFTDAGGTPFLRFTAEVTGSRGNLVEIGGPGSAGGLRVAGWTLGLTLRLVAGGVSVEPVMNLRGVVLPGQSQPRDFSYTDLATLASNAVQGFETA